MIVIKTINGEIARQEIPDEMYKQFNRRGWEKLREEKFIESVPEVKKVKGKK